MTQKIKKRGPGRPKGSKNKPKLGKVVVAKRGRGRPKGSKNKVKTEPNIDEVLDIPHPNPQHEWERIDNIRHMVSFYQHPDGRKKLGIFGPKKRGRKSALENFDAPSYLEKMMKNHFLKRKVCKK